MQHTPATSAFFATTVLFIQPLFATEPPTADRSTVTVEIQDGRIVTGEVDHRTNDESLWLRFASGQLVLASSLAWDEVRCVHVGAARLSSEEFRPLARQLASNQSPDSLRRPAMFPRPEQERPAATANGRLYVIQPPRPERQAAALRVEGSLQNWDADAEADGIEIRVMPVSAAGELVPLEGVLTVTLVGASYYVRPRERPLRELDHWSQRVRSSDFDAWGAVYRLAFRSVHPDRDPRLSPYGRIEARLDAFRQGPFQATCSLRIRAYDPLGDQQSPLGPRYGNWFE